MSLDVNTILAAIAPGFAASPSAAVFIEMATAQTNPCFFKAMTSKAIALRAAHEWAMSTRGSAETGPLSGRRMGPTSVSFANSGGSGSLSSTRFGRELQGLIESMGVSATVTGADFPCGE